MNTEKKSLYIETSIPSYATARDSRDMTKFNRQVLTRAFWETERQKFRLFVSQVVLDECSGGDPEAARRRREFIDDIETLQVTTEIERLAPVYQKLLGIPDRAKADCLHWAFGVIYHIDFLLSWNLTHFNTVAQTKIQSYNEKHGLWTPVLATPENIAILSLFQN
jgi:hypothetical protein